jgi:hypothetical protein
MTYRVRTVSPVLAGAFLIPWLKILENHKIHVRLASAYRLRNGARRRAGCRRLPVGSAPLSSGGAGRAFRPVNTICLISSSWRRHRRGLNPLADFCVQCV